jgi:hypothetical protein
VTPPETGAAPGEADPVERVRELERFALARLPSMQLADGVFCHQVGVEGGCRPEGRSLRYTLIVLIGLLRAEEHGFDHPFHTGALRTTVLSRLDSEELTAGDIGLAIWAESRMDGTAVEELIGVLEARLEAGRGLGPLMTMEAAWILIGLVEAAARGETAAGERLLAMIRNSLLASRSPGSGLLTHVERGPRRRFPHFADQIYAALALSELARVREDGEAREACRALGDRLLAAQMLDGAWPWIYDPVRGTVVEPYELYSVHQDSMAMIGLHGVSEATADPKYRLSAVSGLAWNYGNNVLGAEMFDRGTGLIHRSIRRRQRLHRASQARNAARAYTGTRPRLPGPEGLELNRTMRPYHLGWILEAWAGREHLAAYGS